MKKLNDYFTLLTKRFISFAPLSKKSINVGSMNNVQVAQTNMAQPLMDMAQPRQLADDIIIIEILTRVPAKSVLLLRSVCKLWKSIYLNPDFIKYHLEYISNNPNEDDDDLIIKRSVNGSVELAVLSSSSLSETRLLDFPYSRPPSSHALIYLVGSVKGLVCLFLPQLKQFMLWNPAIRQAMKINSPVKQFTLRDDVSASFYGFCWDVKEHDFKVVNCFCNKKLGYHSLYVYSCNSASWSLLNNFKLPVNQTYFRVPSVTVNGVPYWKRTWYSWRNDMKLHMVTFEVGSKKFKVLPVLHLPGYSMPPVAVNLKESLSALAFKTRCPCNMADVYCLDKECSVWSKKYSIIGPITGPVHALLGCFKYGDVIVFNIRGKYKCYDHKTNRTTDLGNQDGQLTDCISYKASLVFLRGMKPQHQVDPILWKQKGLV